MVTSSDKAGSKVGTRGSALALAQTRTVIEQIQQATGLQLTTAIIETSGDTGTGERLGEGIFVKEIQRALTDGEIDLAVHSMKDLPTEPSHATVIAAVPERGDPRDAIVGSTLDALGPAAKVGTSSARRAAQLLHLKPDLTIMPIRGNVPTRVAKVREGLFDAVVVAAAGLERLGLTADQILELELMLPAPAQGALAVEVRAEDAELISALGSIDHPASRMTAETERSLLRRLGGGCLLPIGASAAIEADELRLTAVVCSSDGTRYLRTSTTGSVGEQQMVVATAAEDLKRQGAHEILEAH